MPTPGRAARPQDQPHPRTQTQLFPATNLSLGQQGTTALGAQAGARGQPCILQPKASCSLQRADQAPAGTGTGTETARPGWCLSRQPAPGGQTPLLGEGTGTAQPGGRGPASPSTPGSYLHRVNPANVHVAVGHHKSLELGQAGGPQRQAQQRQQQQHRSPGPDPRTPLPSKTCRVRERGAVPGRQEAGAGQRRAAQRRGALLGPRPALLAALRGAATGDPAPAGRTRTRTGTAALARPAGQVKCSKCTRQTGS